MLALTRQLILRAYFSETKMRRIILSNDNNFTNYSFLQIKLQRINSEFSQTYKKLNWESLNNFLLVLNQRRHILQQLSNDDFGHKDLEAIQNLTYPISPIVKRYVKDIVTLRESYIKVCTEINRKIIESNNIFEWLRICVDLQIVQLNVWNKLLANCSQRFIDYSLTQQNMIISYVHYYLKDKFISFTYLPSKFLYRQNYLNDLTNFRELIKQFLLSVTKNHEGDDNIKDKIEKINDIIEKVCKTVIIDFNELIEIFIDQRLQFQKIVQKRSIDILIQILRLLSIIGYYQQNLFDKIYNKLSKNWKIWSITKKQADKMNFVSRLLSIWANTVHYKVQIYQQIIKTFIVAEIQQQSTDRNHSILLYNMVAAGINDYDFLQLFRVKITKDIPMSNKYLHITHHYLSLINKTKGYCTYAACNQVNLVQDIVKNNNGKVYLNCMERRDNENQLSKQQQKRRLSFVNKSSIQDNPPEEFWLKIAHKAYQNISKKYPHANNQLVFNFSFCVFQIDALIIIDNNYIAFELSGSHYNLKDGKSVLLDKTQGKKILKEQILKGYGLKMMNFNSTNMIERNINSFNDFQGGVKYFSMRLEETIKNSK